jgi:hypothetical protein
MVGALDWMVVALASLLTARARWLVGMTAFVFFLALMGWDDGEDGGVLETGPAR